MVRRIQAQTATAEVKAPNSFFDAINNSKVSSTTKEKKDKIQVLTPDQDLRQKIDEYVEWKNREKEAKAEKESREGGILEYAEKVRDDEGFNGNYQKSYRVAGIDSVVTVVSADKFSKIRTEDEGEIEKLLGNRIDEFIEKKIGVTLKAEVFKDSELQNELMTLLGDKFAKFFDSKVERIPAEGYDRKIYTLSRKVVDALRQFIIQAKPSVR